MATLVRDGVGVDVVDAARRVGAEAREHGHVAGADEQREERVVDADDVADEAEVDRARARRRRRRVAGALRGVDDARARAVQADGCAPAASERGAEIDVELAGDDHLHHVERRLVGDAAAARSARRLPELLLELGRLRAAAVDDDHGAPVARELGDVGGDRRHVRACDDLAAELDDDAAASRALTASRPGPRA